MTVKIGLRGFIKREAISRLRLASALFLIILTFFISPQLLAQTKKLALRISGSSTLLPFVQSAAELFCQKRPELLLTVSGTGTGEGIRSLIYGNVDIATASRDMAEVERQEAKQAGLNLIKKTVALDCLVVIVHPSNPVSNLTMEQLKGLYTGRYANWNQLGGPDMVIVAVNRDSSSGTFEMWIDKVLSWERHRRDAQVQSSSGGALYAVAGNRHAVGYVSMGFVSPMVKSLTVNGVIPSQQTVSDGSYPISRELFMFYNKGPKVQVQDFLNYLDSHEGLDLIKRAGFLPPSAGLSSKKRAIESQLSFLSQGERPVQNGSFISFSATQSLFWQGPQ
ncbi:MAG: PstS family phosphate ABC transporter substrate-binding protein [Deltaproteobacteria bacterium]|nr:PstS family phosphate ABC transporter substrate-binding protein [Deltaproteobacteria bacterium]